MENELQDILIKLWSFWHKWSHKSVKRNYSRIRFQILTQSNVSITTVLGSI